MLIPFHSPTSDIGYSFIGSNTDAVDGSSFTFSSEGIGDTDASRLVVVMFGYKGGFTVSSATIGGVSASVSLQTNSGLSRIGMLTATVPTGTTADIVFTMGGSVSNMAISVYRLVGLNSATPTDTDTITGGTLGLTNTVDISAGGIAISARHNYRAANVGFAWTGTTGVTEDVEIYHDTDSNLTTASVKVSGAVSAGTAICTADNATADQTQITAAFR